MLTYGSTSYSRHFTRTFLVTPLTERTRQCPALDGPAQCLLTLVSSLPVFAEAVNGLLTGPCSCCSCPATASMFLKWASQKSHCPPPLNLAVLHLRASGVPFLFSLTVQQHSIFFFVKSLQSSGKDKKLSMQIII